MKNKFDFKPFQQVLVRDDANCMWSCSHFSHLDEDGNVCCSNEVYFEEVIPYEGNEHLRGTTDDYVEPKDEPKMSLKDEPKDGDVVVSGWRQKRKVGEATYCEWIAIVRGEIDEYGYDSYFGFVSKADSPKSEGYWFDSFCDAQQWTRLATEEEKQLLLSKLYEIGKDWDSEKKEIVDWKWEPVDDETYYFPGLNSKLFKFETVWSVWYGDDMDLERKKRNFVFRTEEECQVMCDKLNAAIKNVK